MREQLRFSFVNICICVQDSALYWWVRLAKYYIFHNGKNECFVDNIKHKVINIKAWRMGPLVVLVSPCFRENVVFTCKIGSLLCSLDNLLQKNVFAFFFGNQISNWCSSIFDLLFSFLSHQGKVTKIPSAHISLTYIHVKVFCSPY